MIFPKNKTNLLLDLHNAIIIWFMGDACAPDFIAEIRRGIIELLSYYFAAFRKSLKN